MGYNYILRIVIRIFDSEIAKRDFKFKNIFR